MHPLFLGSFILPDDISELLTNFQFWNVCLRDMKQWAQNVEEHVSNGCWPVTVISWTFCQCIAACGWVLHLKNKQNCMPKRHMFQDHVPTAMSERQNVTCDEQKSDHHFPIAHQSLLSLKMTMCQIKIFLWVHPVKLQMFPHSFRICSPFHMCHPTNKKCACFSWLKWKTKTQLKMLNKIPKHCLQFSGCLSGCLCGCWQMTHCHQLSNCRNQQQVMVKW